MMKSIFTLVLFTWCVLPVVASDDASLRGFDSWDRRLSCTEGKTCFAVLQPGDLDDPEKYKEQTPKTCCGDEECQPEGLETSPGVFEGRCVPKNV